MAIKQKEDPYFGQVYQFQAEGTLPEDERLQKTLQKESNPFELVEGVLHQSGWISRGADRET